MCLFEDGGDFVPADNAASMIETRFGPWSVERLVGFSVTLGAIVGFVVGVFAAWLL